MNHSNTIQTILIAFALYSCTSNDYEKSAWNVAKEQSNSELVRFLNHYKDSKTRPHTDEIRRNNANSWK